MSHLPILLDIATDLTAALSSADRNRRLLAALRPVIPYEAAALLRLEGDALVPVAAEGLSPAALGRRYLRKEHPRLEIICQAEGPVLFPADAGIPDPFDGALLGDAEARQPIHACLGCPLRARGKLVGALTADARAVHAFDAVDLDCLAAVAALAAAEIQTTQLIEALERTAERQGMIARDLMREASQSRGNPILGSSAAMKRLRAEIDLVARSDFPVLITGETGTGKELVAQALHAASHRALQPLIHVNCAALPESLVESELFGHLKGAFTGAAADRPGKFEVADRGTLFLDEVGELPLLAQPKLLRALQEGEIQRVGSDRTVSVDTRVIAATNRDLEAEVRSGRFRADLFHRLNVYPLHVPPLRARPEDVALLAGYFGDLARRRLGLGPVRLAADALSALSRARWPGNVRELENTVLRGVLKASARVPRGEPVILHVDDLGGDLPVLAGDSAESRSARAFPTSPGTSSLLPPAASGTVPTAPAVSAAPPAAIRMRDALQEYQRGLVRAALAAHANNWAAAARSLGLERGNFHRLAIRLGFARGQPDPRQPL